MARPALASPLADERGSSGVEEPTSARDEDEGASSGDEHAPPLARTNEPSTEEVATAPATNDAPVEAPGEAPGEAPVEAPVEAPGEAPVEAPDEGVLRGPVPPSPPDLVGAPGHAEALHGATRAAGPRPPELVHFVEATYPGLADAAADVVLELTIAASGEVVDATVVEDPGQGFGEAARVAARGFRFRPAEVEGVAVPAKIRFTYRFEAPPTSTTTTTTTTDAGRDAAPEAGGEVISVRVRPRSAAEERRHSVDAVQVIELGDRTRQVVDLGTVMERDSGVSLRRSGGLGSAATLTLGGLGGTRVPVFFDGVPLEYLGFVAGLTNVPTALVDRIEVFRGVTPIRLGADALGGAIDLVSAPTRAGLAASVEFLGGSFDTYRLALGSQYRWARSGWFVRGYGYFDHAANDYVIDTEVPDATGRPALAKVRRFHDGYAAGGGGVEVGLAQRGRIERLSIAAFGSHLEKELQHPLFQSTTPFGEARNERTGAGVVLRYRHRWTERLTAAVTAGYAHLPAWLLDQSHCLYNWHGECVLRRTDQRGEIGQREYRQRLVRNVGYGRVHFEWMPHPSHALRLTLAPTGIQRRSEDHRDLTVPVYDPLGGRRNVFKLMTGLEYEGRFWGERVANVLFFKDYVLAARADEPLPNETFRELRRNDHHVGVGDALRLEAHRWVDVKVSYEWAARLPEVDEIYGDGVFVFENLRLRAERSHNVNAGAQLYTGETQGGEFRARIDGFGRWTRDFIVLPIQGRSFQNIDRARALGVDGEFAWTSPGNWVDLRAQWTWQSLVNTSDRGAFAMYQGDRIPNQPWLYTATTLTLQYDDLVRKGDRLALGWSYRYVHAFFYNWESLGQQSSKIMVPSQHLHHLMVSYALTHRDRSLRAALMVDNVGGQPSYDFYAIQKPGRAFYASLAVQL